jgi:hypothetical protein
MPVWRWYGEELEEVLEVDAVTGDPVQTDAEEPIITTAEYAIAILEIKRYEFFPFDPNVILDYSCHVNSNTFWGAPEGTARMLCPEASEKEVINGVDYVHVTYKIKFKIKKIAGVMQEDSWKARLLHHGFKFREAVGSAPEIYTDKHGNPATVNLTNGTGTKKADGADPDYKEFNRYPKVDFDTLSLGPFV